MADLVTEAQLQEADLPCVIIACAAHISDHAGAQRLLRCLLSIENADNFCLLKFIPDTNMRKQIRNMISVQVHLAISKAKDSVGAPAWRAIEQFLKRMPNIYTYESKTRLSQFQHYERIMQELETDIINKHIPKPDSTYIMFSDGDDIWDERRIYHANLCIMKTWEKGSLL